MLDKKQSLEVFNLYGTFSEDVYYAHKRLQKIGAKPFRGVYDGTSKEIFIKAMQQAKEENNYVSVYLNCGEITGLFMVGPEKLANDLVACAIRYEVYKNRPELRWDKPIDEQKKEEEFDKFKTLQYEREIIEKYGKNTIEICYANERLKKLGVQHYQGKEADNPEAIFNDAVKQAKNTGKRTSFCLNDGRVGGLFVVSPDEKNDFNSLVLNQKKMRWDKPIEQQKAEEKAMLYNHEVSHTI